MKSKKNAKKTNPQSKRIIFGIIIAVIILSGIAYYFLKGNILPQKNQYTGNVTDIKTSGGEIIAYKYNNFQFEKNGGYWLTQIQRGAQPYIITFLYGPLNVENISLVFNDNYFEQMTRPRSHVYVTFDHESSNASYIATSAINIITNLNTVYYVNVTRGCLKNSSNCGEVPIVTCENHPHNAVIQFVESEVPYAVYNLNCLTIYGNNDNFIRTTEKIILNWYKIV
jgi:hypothetical protein